VIDPVALKIGSFSIRWYGLSWVASFLFMTYFPPKDIIRFPKLSAIWHDVVANAVIASVIGGRIGEMVFYRLDALIDNPLSLFAIWEGGLSFHGALLASVCTLLMMSRKYKVPFFHMTDIGVMNLPLALGLVRVANFINGELYGRVTDQSWGMRFYGSGPMLRHPSQLYEAALEGLVLWLLLRYIHSFKPKPGVMSTSFVLGYASLRLVVEFWFREPTYEWSTIISTGQLLCSIMLLIGILMMVYTRHYEVQNNEAN
tara:strand:- start:41 stop:811 length:771 start_codon:yes stop_codon:yes gene_type:complete